MAKERIHWVDIAKGLLILLLLIHHFGSAIKGSIIPKEDFSFVGAWQFVFTAFFMQAFLFMSGFCSSFTTPVDVFLKKLLKQLIVPFCFFELITCTYWSSSDRFSIHAVLDYWIESGGTHYWFLNALILSKVYIYIFLRLYKNEYSLIISSLLLLIVAIVLNDYDIGYNFFCFRQSLGSIFFVALGFFVKSRQELFEKSLKWGG
jgi:fucose 4-O-acetylase-like acetyltransferase